MDEQAQPQLLLFWLLCSAVQALVTGRRRRRRRSKISVPVGYKFSPTDEDLVNHHLKRKLINLTDQFCLIPDYHHYEAEPWDLITKYNELSDGESNNDECFFFTTNPSSNRVHRSTPKGRWHETSGKKTIQGSDGVAYVMKYFTFKNGHQRTPWRMREFTDPSNKELALCKIFKDVDGQKKKKDGPTSSVIPVPSTSPSISPGSQTPEAYADMSREAPSPTSANLTCNNLAFIAPLQQHPTEERYQPSQKAFCDQFFDFDNPRPHDQFSYPNLMKDGVNSTHHHTEEGSPLAQANKDPLYPHNITPNTGDVPHSKRPQIVEGTSLEASEQRPMKKSRTSVTNSQNLERERNFSSTNNSPFSSSMSFPQGNNMLAGYGSEEVNSEEVASLFNPPNQPMNLESSNYMEFSQHEFQVSQFDQITGPILDNPTMWQETIQDLLDSLSNGTNIEGYGDDSTFRLSPSNYSTYDTSEPTGIKIHEAQQPIQQQALSEPFPQPQSPTQPWNSWLPCSNTTTPQQVDMPIISEVIDDDHQYLREVTESYSPLLI